VQAAGATKNPAVMRAGVSRTALLMLLSLDQPPSWATEQPALGILGGLVLLILGADLLIRGAVWIALVLGISRMAVGLTLVAFGTSAPELLVSLNAAFKGSPTLAMSNVLGSNLMNVLLILGVVGLICPIRLKVDRLELRHMLFATVMLTLPFLLGTGLTRWLAAVMFAHLLLFCSQLLHRERRKAGSDDDRKAPPVPSLWGWLSNLVLLGAGFLVLSLGASWLVDGAIVTASDLGMSEALIGVTILAGGTSLPELATAVIAARKNHPELAIGSILGSNIFNVGSVLGLCGLVEPFPIDHHELLATIIATTVASVWLAAVLGFLGGISRLTAIGFLLALISYMTWEALSVGAP